MVFAFASAAPPSAVPVDLDDASIVILLTYLAAAVVFVICWAARAGLGKIPSDCLPSGEIPSAAPADNSPYLPPATPPPPPVPPVAAESTRFLAMVPLRVPVTPYRLIDLPLIGFVFLVYFALNVLPAGSEEIPLEKKFQPGVLAASIFFQLLLMAIVIAFVRWRVSLTEWLGLRWKFWPLVFAIAPLTVFFMWCFMGALHLSGWNAWLERSLGIESMQEAVKLLQEAKDPLVIVLMAVAAVIVAPLAEEVVFRGYLYPAAKRFCGPAGAIIFSSLVFAAAHGNVVALLPLFTLAVLLCLLYEFTGSIWASISVHFLFNAATVSLQLLARSGIVEIPAPE